MLNIPDILLIVVLSVYLFLVIKKKVAFHLKILTIWLGASLFVDTVMAASRVRLDSLFFSSLSIVILSWLVSYLVIKKDKRRLLTGYVCNISLVMTIGYITFLALGGRLLLPFILFGLIGILSFLFVTLGAYALIIFFFWNARIVLKKESRTLGNMLTLLFGIAGVCLLIMQKFLIKQLPILSYIYTFIMVVLIYFFFTFLTVLTSSLLFNYLKPKFDKDYLVVLGAGLLDGERVTPLLAGRIDAAILFTKQQLARTGKQALLIMSGGQGRDEKVPEAVAMANYALSKGIPETVIMTEENSATTLQNLQFSKTIMDEKQQDKTYKSAFVSNDYHIFRAGLFAKKVGLDSDGIGSRTARYFLPNAFIREYFAIILMYKKRHFLFIILLLVMAVLKAVIEINNVGVS